ncbi:hypothetical protein LMG22037_06167 [Paraburkholderia phenoliruptrix]|jgi:hypothetical protein|uniref:Uncharacterized protein n=1 Tax=Paraburkholderia phenoliruptrix TaxID=252970 RepID=A0A6J5CK86_9BURK|nr:hypothetical protein [Paraburkholderia phenoliruptrix]CAB3737647.1 hypothetical protein LMG22037_06167 [Paraburkholderia phenoliruptrix]
MITLHTDTDLSFAQKLENILTLFELKLTETRQAVASHQSANSEARVLAAIDSITRLECLNWVLEMLPALKNVHQLDPQALLIDVKTAQILFARQLADLNTALQKSDLSLAQFPRIGDEARVELATRTSVLTWVLYVTVDLTDNGE